MARGGSRRPGPWLRCSTPASGTSPPTASPARRGARLALRILTAEGLPEDVSRYDRFHLLRVTLERAELWSWDGEDLTHQVLEPGDHIIVNLGLDTDEDPLVPHFAPLLAKTPSELDAWRGLMAGDGLDPGDERALVVRKEIEGHLYGTTSGVAGGALLGRGSLRVHGHARRAGLVVRGPPVRR